MVFGRVVGVDLDFLTLEGWAQTELQLKALFQTEQRSLQFLDRKSVV